MILKKNIFVSNITCAEVSSHYQVVGVHCGCCWDQTHGSLIGGKVSLNTRTPGRHVVYTSPAVDASLEVLTATGATRVIYKSSSQHNMAANRSHMLHTVLYL